MISRFNLLPHRHFIYRFLIETLFDSCFGKDQSICSHNYDKTLWHTRTTFCSAVCFTPTTNEQHQCLICRLLVHPVNGQHIFSLLPIHVFLQMVDRISTDRRGSKLLPRNLVSVCVFAKITIKAIKLVYWHQWSIRKLKWENANRTHPN